MKIVNFKKFFRSIFLVIGIIVIFNIFMNNVTLSNQEVAYKEIYISLGDTLWELAKEESKTNSYYSDKDLRYIVKDIKKVNNLANSNVDAGQKLLIPTI